jgi:hypothetical protein
MDSPSSKHQILNKIQSRITTEKPGPGKLDIDIYLGFVIWNLVLRSKPQHHAGAAQ